jgi:hypothetical protein
MWRFAPVILLAACTSRSVQQDAAAIADPWIDGDLVGTFAGGTATFDLSTGAPGQRTCGSSFRLSDFRCMEGPDEDSIREAR